MGINFFRRDDHDSRFLLYEHLRVDKLLGYERFKDFSIDDFQMIIDEAGKVSRGVLGPAMQDAEREGCRYLDGIVRVPKVFHECWPVFAENGWIGLSNSPEFGGQGLPHLLTGIVNEFFIGANFAMMGYVGLAVGNGRLIEDFGTDRDKSLFVEKMYTGVWGGTMCLTEPDAGSDVGMLRTKAIHDTENEDPRIYEIEGTKRFITCGEHDLTKNIIHLVLARIVGAPDGTKGLSLFIVPKIWVNPDGSLGEPNDVFCSGIEHKMGLNGLATCTLNFGENGRCRGILLGEPNTGMAQMFQMMNESRVLTGLQSLSMAANAYDIARQYAKERIQGQPFAGRSSESVPIIQHEDIRRMLMNLKSGTEAMRAMIGKVNYLIDVSENDPNKEIRKKHQQRVSLFTPLLKGYCTDFSYALTREAIQVLGGVGYCSEFPAEQYARDCKIGSIWEGTTYIQSLDFVGRKLSMEGGRVFQEWIGDVIAFAKGHGDNPNFAPDFKLLYKAAEVVADLSLQFARYFQEDKRQFVALSATRFLECCSEVLMAQLILEQGLIAREKLDEFEFSSADGIFYRSKVETARYFCRNILPNVFARQVCFQQEDSSALDIPEEGF